MACDISVTGNLGRDPEMRYLESGQQVTKFTLAARQAKVRGKELPALWFTVEVWGATAEWVANNLVKGETVYVRGELRLNQWTDRESGEVREALTIIQARVEKLWAPRQGGEGQPPTAAAAPAPAQAAAQQPAAAPAYQQQPLTRPAAAPPQQATSAFV
jgi:single-strand DNA-binding protein